YLENTLGASNILRLIKFSTWGSFIQLGSDVQLASVSNTLHTLRMAFHSGQVAVYFDGAQRISVSDPDPNNARGSVVAEMWTPNGVPYVMSFDDFAVNDLVKDDSNYTMTEDTTLNISAAAGVLTNDTSVYTTSLAATLVSPPASGTLNLST